MLSSGTRTPPSLAPRRRACALAAGTKLDPWILQGLARKEPSDDRVALLELAAERGLTVPSAAESLQSANPREIALALRLLQRAEPIPHERRVLELLEHPDPLVRDAALLTSLHHGSLQGWAVCQTLALDPENPHPLAMTLLAGLGEPGQHKRLVERLDSDALRPAVLRALGYSGNVGLVPALVFHLHADDPRTAKLAGEAIATIAGEEVNALVPPKKPAPETNGELPPPEEDEEAKRSLPPLEEDDLDADLVPPAEAGLPDPRSRSCLRLVEDRPDALRSAAPLPRRLPAHARGVRARVDAVSDAAAVPALAAAVDPDRGDRRRRDARVHGDAAGADRGAGGAGERGVGAGAEFLPGREVAGESRVSDLADRKSLYLLTFGHAATTST